MQKSEIRNLVLKAFNEVAAKNLPADAPDETDVPLVVTFKLGDLKQMARAAEHWETVTRPALNGATGG